MLISAIIDGDSLISKKQVAGSLAKYNVGTPGWLYLPSDPNSLGGKSNSEIDADCKLF